MKVKSNRHQASILTKRLTSKVIKNYILTFFILLILLFSILCPVLIKNSLQTQNEYASFIAKQYNQLILSSQSTTQSLINTPELNRLLTSYSRHPSAYTKSKIDEQLQNFLSTFSKVKYCMIENEDGVIFESFTNADIGAKECRIRQMFPIILHFFLPNCFPVDQTVLQTIHFLFPEN